MLFSQRYIRSLEQKRLDVQIPDIARRKLWTWLTAHNQQMRIHRDPNDNWTDDSSTLEEVESDLLMEHGWERIPGAPQHREIDSGNFQALRHLVLHGDGQFVFDTLELSARFMDRPEEEKFRKKINEIFELHECP